IRVLIAFEDQYRVYSAAITGAVRRARPTDEVLNANIGVLEREVRSFAPHLIVSSLPAPTNYLGEWFSWVRLSPDPNRTSEIYLGGKRRESLNPSLEELLSALEETERLLGGSTRTKGSLHGTFSAKTSCKKPSFRELSIPETGFPRMSLLRLSNNSLLALNE